LTNAPASVVLSGCAKSDRRSAAPKSTARWKARASTYLRPSAKSRLRRKSCSLLHNPTRPPTRILFKRSS
jgi:hypothetical protein